VTKGRDAGRLQRAADSYAEVYGCHAAVRNRAFHDSQGAATAGPLPYDVYEVTPTVVFGCGTTSRSFRPAGGSAKGRPAS
jgi:hypothetical protein